MASTKLMRLSYFDPKAETRLEAYADTIVIEKEGNVSPVGTNLRSDEELAQMSGDSRNQIHRFIHLNNLIPQLLDMVDAGKLAMRPAVELSYLPAETQQLLLEAIESEDCVPSQAQAVKMRKFAAEGRLDNNVILSIMQEDKVNQSTHFKLPRDKIRSFFPAGCLSKSD